MTQIEKEHAGSGIDQPAPRTIREKIADGFKTRPGAKPAAVEEKTLAYPSARTLQDEKSGAAPARGQT